MKTRRQQTKQDEQRAWQRLKRKHRNKTIRHMVLKRKLGRARDLRILGRRTRLR